jgi:simple sugar transport system ATP-binding protein
VSVLEVQGVAKSFGAVQALDGVDLRLNTGEALGLVGDNGAGKSTLLKILGGNFPPDRGELRVQGRRVAFSKPLDARRHGIETVYQDLALCNNLTATANIFLGRELRRKRLAIVAALDFEAMREQARSLFAELHSETDPDSLVAELSGGQRQAVAIARTRLSNPTAVLLDEPTAAIGVRQVSEVLALIQRLKEQNVAVLLISHRFDDIFEVCDRVAVLRRGRKVAERRIAETTREEITGLVTGAIQE